MAIIHIALFDAINMASRFNEKDPAKPNYLFDTYSKGLSPVNGPVSLNLAIAYAAGETLKELYKAQAPVITDFIAKDEAAIVAGKDPDMPQFKEARELGIAAARAILADRKSDGAEHSEPQVGDPGFPLSEVPGEWRPDPVSNIITALGGKWGTVRPFVIKNVPTFRPPLTGPH